MTQEPVEALKQQADELIQQGDYTRAIDIYNKVLIETPMDYEANAMLGTIHGELGDTLKAVQYLQKATEIDSFRTDAWLTLAHIQQYSGEDSQALESLRNASSAAPNDADIHLMLGNLLLKTNQEQEALSSYIEAVRYDPKNIDAIFCSACLFQKFNDFENAAKGFQAVIELDPKHLDALRRLSNMLLKLDRTIEAEDILHTAIQNFPDDPWLHARLATVYAAQNRLPDALKSIKQARKLEPGSDEIEQCHADILAKQSK